MKLFLVGTDWLIQDCLPLSERFHWPGPALCTFNVRVGPFWGPGSLNLLPNSLQISSDCKQWLPKEGLRSKRENLFDRCNADKSWFLNDFYNITHAKSSAGSQWWQKLSKQVKSTTQRSFVLSCSPFDIWLMLRIWNRFCSQYNWHFPTSSSWDPYWQFFGRLDFGYLSG